MADRFHSTPVHRSYDPTYFTTLFEIEDQHFWFRVRNRVIAALLKQITKDLSSGYRVLEVGCGTGNTLRVLASVCSRGVVIGMDLFAEGLQYARRRTSCSLVQGDMHAPPFQARFDLIGVFDVLEHLPDDLQVLSDLRAMLVPGGAMLLTVPAHPSLWSYFDEASHHCRRYTLAELENKLSSTSFRVEYVSYHMAGIFPLVWLGRRLTRVIGRPNRNVNRSDELAARELRVTPIINDLLTWVLSQEIHSIEHRRQIPIGTSLLAVARKD